MTSKYFDFVDTFTTIKEMAGHRTTFIRAVQSHGLYVMAGYSAGDPVALWVTDKLKNASEVITHLTILDATFTPTRERQVSNLLTGLLVTSIVSPELPHCGGPTTLVPEDQV